MKHLKSIAIVRMRIRTLALALTLTLTATSLLPGRIALAQEPAFTPKPITLPTEQEAAKIFHATLMVNYHNKPPQQFSIYPALFKEHGTGTATATNTFSALIEGEDAKEFIARLAHPTSLGAADEGCENVIVAWHRGASGFPLFIGEIHLSTEGAHVRIRLFTDNPIHPRLDLTYDNQGLTDWLQKRAIKAAQKHN